MTHTTVEPVLRPYIFLSINTFLKYCSISMKIYPFRIFNRLLNAGAALSLAFIVCCTGCIDTQYLAAPVLLPDIRPEMNTPGFWTGRHPDPDRTVMPHEKIKQFNASIRDELGSVKDISRYPLAVSGAEVYASIEKQLNSMKEKGYYRLKGKRAGSGFFRVLAANMNLSEISEQVEVAFGFTVAYTDQRVLPTTRGLYKKPINQDFDRLQNSALDMGTPLAILHLTRDEKWVYGVSPLSSGWLRSEKVAVCSSKSLKDYLHQSSFVVVTSARADVFLDGDLMDYHARARMGTRFPGVVNADLDTTKISIPCRENDGSCRFVSAFLNKGDVCEGYLPYTPRNIISQAFKLLNAPYGWGGMYGEQDCSRFIQELFATVGIFFPRNSSRQAEVGTLAAFFDEESSDEDKLTLLTSLTSFGITTLRMKGHIMLFLGMVDGSPYSIHAVWGYSEPHWRGERIWAIKRTVVTSLRLGEGSSAGSLLKRLNTVRIVKIE